MVRGSSAIFSNSIISETKGRRKKILSTFPMYFITRNHILEFENYILNWTNILLNYSECTSLIEEGFR